MTAAVCLKCGKMKFGAWVRCPKCGFAPATEEDQVKSIFLSDHNLSSDDLKAISQLIADGKTVNFPEEELKQWTEELKNTASRGELRPPKGCLIFQWLLLGILFALLAAVIGMIVYLRH